MTGKPLRAIMKLAALIFVISIVGAEANGQATPIKEETLRFFKEYNRIMHLMEHKEISREALADFDRAFEFVNAGNANGALDALEAAQTKDVMKEESRVLWAPYSQLIADQGLFTRGTAFLQKLTIEHPKLSHLHTNLASIYGMYAGWLKANDPKRLIGISQLSLAEYEVALALDPDSFQANYGQATYLSYVPGKQDVWEKQFRKLISMRPADLHGFPFASVYYSFVDALIRSDQEKKARMVLKEALALYPKSAGLQALAKRLPDEPKKSPDER